MYVFYELSFAHVNFMRAELCKCEFYEMSIENVNFMRAELHEWDYSCFLHSTQEFIKNGEGVVTDLMNNVKKTFIS